MRGKRFLYAWKMLAESSSNLRYRDDVHALVLALQAVEKDGITHNSVPVLTEFLKFVLSPDLYRSPPHTIRRQLLGLVASLAAPILPRPGHIAVLEALLSGGVCKEQLLRAAAPPTALGARGSYPQG